MAQDGMAGSIRRQQLCCRPKQAGTRGGWWRGRERVGPLGQEKHQDLKNGCGGMPEKSTWMLACPRLLGRTSSGDDRER